MKLPLGPDVRLLTHQSVGLVALEKPAGVRSHPNGAKADAGALLTTPWDAATEAYLDADGQPAWWLLHRLDAPTSGVILLANSAPLAAVVQALFAQRQVQKAYYAVIRGRPKLPQMVWRDRLLVQRTAQGLRTQVSSQGEPAEAAMKLQRLGEGPPLRALIELRPATGRTHQLRVQCAVRQLPILGDATYGDFRLNRELTQRRGLQRLMLHAAHLELAGTFAGQPWRLKATSPLPEAFTQLLTPA